MTTLLLRQHSFAFSILHYLALEADPNTHPLAFQRVILTLALLLDFQFVSIATNWLRLSPVQAVY